MSAILSPCGKYRYQLARTWGEGRRVCFIGVNPSTADADTDDATVRKWRGFAKSWGFGGFIVGNLFAYRATDVRELGKTANPFGEDDDTHLKAMIAASDLVVPCWGSTAKLPERLRYRCGYVGDLIRASGVTAKCLGVTKCGSPRHPLMLSYATQLEDWPNA